ncbi:SIR2 family protein [Stenotrophomonas maltophilia]|nr:SIR2 family protein [Stenotrophomonas maltophilia]MBN4965189.1 SIR2 family protein [Stenotrophomonas maltophilia]
MSFDVNAIYDKPLNFLIGSGASFGLLPTLALKVTSGDGRAHTIETLATSYEQQDDRRRYTALFMHYYDQCIRPAQQMSFEAIRNDPERSAVQANYERFIRAVLTLLQRRRGVDRRCNVFTTNYDGCLPEAANRITLCGGQDFVVNDGSRGFFQHVVEARNYNTYLTRTGIFERHRQTVPQINIINLHGSVYWSRHGDQVHVTYNRAHLMPPPLIDEEMRAAVHGYWQQLDAGGPDTELPDALLTQAQMDAFWTAYRRLPIVNPTKWKFHETVFEEHYYHMLRMLSFELERENAVLITFGFSFADEHILNLVKRSLSNPQLMVFVTCFNEAEYARLSAQFADYANVACVTATDGYLTFDKFNALLSAANPLPVAGPTVGAVP